MPHELSVSAPLLISSPETCGQEELRAGAGHGTQVFYGGDWLTHGANKRRKRIRHCAFGPCTKRKLEFLHRSRTAIPILRTDVEDYLGSLEWVPGLDIWRLTLNRQATPELWREGVPAVWDLKSRDSGTALRLHKVMERIIFHSSKLSRICRRGLMIVSGLSLRLLAAPSSCVLIN